MGGSEMMNRQQARKLSKGSSSPGMKMLKTYMAQYGIGPMQAKLISREYADVVEKLQAQGVDVDDDYAVMFLVGCEAIHKFVPEKMRPVIPFLQGESGIPDFIPEPFLSIVKGGSATIRMIKHGIKIGGKPALHIHRYTDDQMAEWAKELS